MVGIKRLREDGDPPEEKNNPKRFDSFFLSQSGELHSLGFPGAALRCWCSVQSEREVLTDWVWLRLSESDCP